MAKQSFKDNAVPDDDIVGEIDPRIYNEVARCARLLSVQLIESNFSISPQFFDPNVEGKLSVDFADTHGGFDIESRVATCVFSFESHVKKHKKKVFNCRSKFVVFYEVSMECDEIHAVAFARKTGLLAAYPYFRAHVASTAGLANAEVPILPVISSMPVKHRIKESNMTNL